MSLSRSFCRALATLLLLSLGGLLVQGSNEVGFQDAPRLHFPRQISNSSKTIVSSSSSSRSSASMPGLSPETAATSTRQSVNDNTPQHPTNPSGIQPNSVSNISNPASAPSNSTTAVNQVNPPLSTGFTATNATITAPAGLATTGVTPNNGTLFLAGQHVTIFCLYQPVYFRHRGIHPNRNNTSLYSYEYFNGRLLADNCGNHLFYGWVLFYGKNHTFSLVRLFYWPTPGPNPPVSSTSLSGREFFSPSVYWSFDNIYTSDLCNPNPNAIGTTAILSLPAGQVSILFRPPNATEDGTSATKPFALSSLANCPATPTSGQFIFNTTCVPLLAFPTEVTSLFDWSTCIPFFNGVRDPPTALQSAGVLAAPTDSSSSPPPPTSSPTAEPESTTRPSQAPSTRPAPPASSSVEGSGGNSNGGGSGGSSSGPGSSSPPPSTIGGSSSANNAPGPSSGSNPTPSGNDGDSSSSNNAPGPSSGSNPTPSGNDANPGSNNAPGSLSGSNPIPSGGDANSASKDTPGSSSSSNPTPPSSGSSGSDIPGSNSPGSESSGSPGDSENAGGSSSGNSGTPAAITSIGGVTATPISGNSVVIGSQTLSPGGPPATISIGQTGAGGGGTNAGNQGGSSVVVSVGSSNLVVGSSTLGLPQATNTGVSVGGQSLIPISTGSASGGISIAGSGLTAAPGQAPAVISGKTTISVNPSGSVVVESGGVSSTIPAEAIRSPVNIGGQLLTPVGSNTLVVDHSTISSGGPGLTLGSSTTISIGTSNNIIIAGSDGTSTVAFSDLETQSTLSKITLGAQDVVPITNGPHSGEVLVGGSLTLSQESALTVDGTKISLGSSELVVGHETIPISNGVFLTPAAVTAGAILAGGTPITAGSNGDVVANSKTLKPGEGTQIDGTSISVLSDGSVVIQGHTFAIPSSGQVVEATGTALQIGSDKITTDGFGDLIIGTVTIKPGSETTLDGHTLSVGSSRTVVIDGSTFSLPPSSTANGDAIASLIMSGIAHGDLPSSSTQRPSASATPTQGSPAATSSSNNAKGLRAPTAALRLALGLILGTYLFI
ncbi:hypothetical protein NA57DRAFT_54541 [Rhizodiscina lignyota]|uniref:Hyphally-regulated cell wall protein N-terminal domain-containing protein n=1 Tax=Rhizodiscina lignyota TaxID=1504668 RepID=A0A9P4M7I0_9PEZI|nr:hypothetical protein NA57DRAFT_54541 [Rhizodiscina lignyota]